MDQMIVNWGLGVFAMLIGIMVRSLWQAMKDLQTTDKNLVEKINRIEVLVAGQYVKKDEFERLSQAIFLKLDKIDNKLDSKEDKS